MPSAVMPGPLSHPVNPSVKRSDRRAAGDAADRLEQPLVVHDQEQQAEHAVLIHALLPGESRILAVGKMRVTDGLLYEPEQLRINKRGQPDGMRRIERLAHGVQRAWRLRADECRACELQ